LLLAVVALVTVTWAGNARAQALFPHTYGIACTGEDGSGNQLSLVGNIQFTSATAAVGGAEFIKGSLISFTTLSPMAFTNGTSNPQGTTGNFIPKGCFTGTATCSSDCFGVLNSFFGCYNETTHGFDMVQTQYTSLGSGSALTCHAKEM
jgi:hypothetical protein